MLAIYKRELKAYFSSPLGWIVMAILTATGGGSFVWFNLRLGYPWFGMGLYQLNTYLVLLVIVPIITMRIMSEDRRQKTDQLLYTAPVRIIDIVLGKYLSVVTVFAISLVSYCIYPVVLVSYGKSVQSMAMDYVTILMFFLLGAAFLAIGFYISTLTEHQVLAAILTIAVLGISFLSTLLAGLLPTTSTVSLISFAGLIIVFSVIFYFMIKNAIITIVVGVLLEGVLAAVYIFKSTWLEGLINKVLGVLDMTQRLYMSVFGELDLTIVMYFLSVIVLFLFLSVQAIYKRRWS